MDRSRRGATRRDVLTYGTALAASGGLAGCSSILGGDTADAEAGTGSYTVSMLPMGEVTFESPPETVFTRLTHHADMAFALGCGDSITAMHAPDYYDGLWNQFVERLPGVTLDWTGLYSSWKPSKEKLYELDSDVHLADPAWIAKQDAWSREDLEEVATKISPWFGNSLSDRHAEPALGWKAGYEYYGLWEQFEIVAEAFKERNRYEALAAVHDDLLSTIQSGLPPESERPSAVMLASADLDEIYAYTLDNPGFLTAHTRPLGPKDAFDGEIETNTVVDFEALLSADPDVIFFLGGFEPGTSLPKREEAFRADPVASEITAVQNGRMYPQGARYQGPILHLFQLEMTAKQLYPEQFGEWPTYEEGPYPEIPTEEQLFDRQKVAAVIRGDL
ncbi:ABC transporter substrate-binding protein [Halorientalis pallida]|uniref:ABC transporter substrate-binding protein n=1 Tax=Halorientalis pallida TaxID=2479928 RepID=A0A498L6T2_9EURY|nr:ABC transporter substrate-binding protein [Halorientalis pallida]RXK51435.1 ABC transporter substrate-binding protein [Halorientalis pallida]